MKTTLVIASLRPALVVATPAAHAFCGFYVAGGDQQMFNDATQVVLMRDGTRTVLSMQNNYQGPPQDFAMVVPVPVVLHEGDVKTLPKRRVRRTSSRWARRGWSSTGSRIPATGRRRPTTRWPAMARLRRRRDDGRAPATRPASA